MLGYILQLPTFLLKYILDHRKPIPSLRNCLASMRLRIRIKLHVDWQHALLDLLAYLIFTWGLFMTPWIVFNTVLLLVLWKGHLYYEDMASSIYNTADWCHNRLHQINKEEELDRLQVAWLNAGILNQRERLWVKSQGANSHYFIC